jgi:SAM-dependent methyltransferase
MSFNCYLCGCDQSKVLAEREYIRFNCWGRDKKILKCLSCGLVQLFPQWTEDELDDLYSRYWAKEDFEGQKRKVKISEYLPKLLKKERLILEVGCGHGDNVRYLRSKGFNVIGIDKDMSVCDGWIINADFKNYEPHWKPDIIYAIHFFEHSSEPRAFIKWMLDNLPDNGKFILEMPNIDNVLLQLNSYNKFHWYPYHLFFWSPRTIKRLFDGFPVKIEIKVNQEYGLINHLRWLFTGKPGNWNPNIPVIDSVYKAILKLIGFGDTLLIVGNKCSI